MSKVDFTAAGRTIRPDKVVTVAMALREGWLSADTPDARTELSREGYICMPLTAGRTAHSRKATTVDIVCRDADIAELPWHTHVQLLGLAAARRALGIPTGTGWSSHPERHVQYDQATKQFARITVPDGIWDEYGRNGLIRTWILEYSHAEFERKRLRGKILRYGPNPQLWATPSRAHSDVVAGLLDELYPHVPSRVVTVDWTGGA